MSAECETVLSVTVVIQLGVNTLKMLKTYSSIIIIISTTNATVTRSQAHSEDFL
jgi:hypothetical protein